MFSDYDMEILSRFRLNASQDGDVLCLDCRMNISMIHGATLEDLVNVALDHRCVVVTVK